MALLITITDAGRAEIINADNTGTGPVLITEIGFGTGQYAPSKTQTALTAEIAGKRLSSIAGQAVAADTIHIIVKDEGPDAYNVGEFGLYSASGTLVAVYSQTAAAGWIIQKAGASTLLLAVDIILESLDATSLTFGDVTFLNPPATTETPGVVQLENSLVSPSTTKALAAAQGKKLQDEKAPLASPEFTGTPTAPTAAQATNNSQLATTAFVKAAIAALVDSSPGALDTLNELAAALGDDPNFAATMTNALASKLPLAGGAMSGSISYQNVSTGGWARGLEGRLASDGALKAGIGILGTGDSIDVVYLGMGASPWSAGNGVRVTVNGVTVEGPVTFTDTPTAPTAAQTANNTQLATTAFVKAAIAALIDSSPGALDTLNELAAALGDDPNFATTMTNALASKLPLAGGTLTGLLTGKRARMVGEGNDYASGAVELIGNGVEDTVFPTLGFHQPGLYAGSLQLRGGTDFRFYAQGGAVYGNVTAATFNGSNFVGPLTGNADTASGLAIDNTDRAYGSTLQYLQHPNGGTLYPSAAWASGLRFLHNSGEGYYTQISCDFHADNVYLCRSVAGGLSGFRRFTLDGEALPLAGGAMSGSISYQNVSTGGWARGLEGRLASDGALKAGIGILGTGDSIDIAYLGMGASPWSAGNGVRVTANGVTVEGPVTFTDTPTAPTAAQTANNTQLATTAFVKAAIAALIDSSPGALDTLNELAAALGDDPNFAATMTNVLATKLSTSGGTISAVKGAISGDGAQGQLELYNGGASGSAAAFTLHRGGDYAVNFGLDTDNKLKIGGYSMGAVAHELWHAGNLDPTGAIVAFPLAVAPVGFLKANGAAVSRTGYARLFAAIGTNFGVGDGSTTFNLPDLRGEFIRGWDDGRGVDPGRNFLSWQADMLASHTHTVKEGSAGPSGSGEALASGDDYTNAVAYYSTSGATGGSETRPRNVALLYCIKY